MATFITSFAAFTGVASLHCSQTSNGSRLAVTEMVSHSAQALGEADSFQRFEKRVGQGSPGEAR